LSFISGSFTGRYQISNTPGQTPSFTAFGISNFPSELINENQIERNYYNVAAIQKSVGDIDAQLSYFSRLSSVRFTPDLLGDLLYNGIATDIYRSSLLNGVQGDVAYRVHPAHRLRFGFIGSAEKTHVANSSTLLPLDDGATRWTRPSACSTKAASSAGCSAPMRRTSGASQRRSR
jgi:hypothetical protein